MNYTWEFFQLWEKERDRAAEAAGVEIKSCSTCIWNAAERDYRETRAGILSFIDCTHERAKYESDKIEGYYTRYSMRGRTSRCGPDAALYEKSPQINAETGDVA